VQQDVFSLRDKVVCEHRKFATSFTRFVRRTSAHRSTTSTLRDGSGPTHSSRIRLGLQAWSTPGIAGRWRRLGPAEIFRAAGAPLSLYKHQEQATALAAEQVHRRRPARATHHVCSLRRVGGVGGAGADLREPTEPSAHEFHMLGLLMTQRRASREVCHERYHRSIIGRLGDVDTIEGVGDVFKRFDE